MARGFTSLNLSQGEVDQIRHGTPPPVSNVSTPHGPKWHGGVVEKVVAGALLGILAFLWSAGATAVERLGKVPQHELRLNKHDEQLGAIQKTQETEAQSRGRLIELLEAVEARAAKDGKRPRGAGGD